MPLPGGTSESTLPAESARAAVSALATDRPGALFLICFFACFLAIFLTFLVSSLVSLSLLVVATGPAIAALSHRSNTQLERYRGANDYPFGLP